MTLEEIEDLIDEMHFHANGFKANFLRRLVKEDAWVPKTALEAAVCASYTPSFRVRLSQLRAVMRDRGYDIKRQSSSYRLVKVPK